MAKNDTVLIDGIIEHRISIRRPSEDKGEVFELFCLEEILKDRDLSDEELDSGWIDGRDDGGIDGFFVLVNGHVLVHGEPFVWPKKSADLEVWILSCKHHETFQQAPLNAMLASFDEILDLSKNRDSFVGSYSPDLLNARDLLSTAYRKLSALSPNLAFRIIYASRGDTGILGEAVRSRAGQISEKVNQLFSNCEVSFDFVGSAQLIEMTRKAKTFALELKVIDQISTDGNSQVCLVALRDYYDFITNESGELRRYLFDSNVRDFLGDNRVNEEIGRSIEDPSAPDFWWLNNGVTILATRAQAAGKTLHVSDVQIVNGLQTTESLFKSIRSGSAANLDRAVLIKVVTSSDSRIRDDIIKATNNQNTVEVSALRATDKIQRDIEDILEKHSLYYQRRTNYYKNIGKPAERFVAPIYLAAGYIALVRKDPAHALKMRAKAMRNNEQYAEMFPVDYPLIGWVHIAEILKATDTGLETNRPLRGGERFLSNWRSIVALGSVALRYGGFDFGRDYLGAFDVSSITAESVRGIMDIIISIRSSPDRSNFKSPSFVNECCIAVAKEHNLRAAQAVTRAVFARTQVVHAPVTEAQIELVDKALPVQPWSAGIHIKIAGKLGLPPKVVSAAIGSLMASGRRLRQSDGVVFNANGDVVAKDPARFPDG